MSERSESIAEEGAAADGGAGTARRAEAGWARFTMMLWQPQKWSVEMANTDRPVPSLDEARVELGGSTVPARTISPG